MDWRQRKAPHFSRRLAIRSRLRVQKSRELIDLLLSDATKCNVRDILILKGNVMSAVVYSRWELRPGADRVAMGNTALELCRFNRSLEGSLSSRYFWPDANAVVILHEVDNPRGCVLPVQARTAPGLRSTCLTWRTGPHSRSGAAPARARKRIGSLGGSPTAGASSETRPRGPGLEG